ncbi:MAG: hypothetical protein RSD14_01425 [Clostridia bacterium]
MNSDAFIDNYLKEHSSKSHMTKVSVFKFLLVAFAVSILIYLFRPMSMLRQQVIKNFQTYQNTTISYKSYKDTQKRNDKYTPPIQGVITSDYGTRQDPINR